jgi:hypothetical protein
MIRKKRAIYKGAKYRRVSFNNENDHTVCDKINCIYGKLSKHGNWIVGDVESQECKRCRIVRKKLYANLRNYKYSYALC